MHPDSYWEQTLGVLIPGVGASCVPCSLFTGRIDAQEIVQSLRDLGVKISEQQAEKILKRSASQLPVLFPLPGTQCTALSQVPFSLLASVFYKTSALQHIFVATSARVVITK